MGELYDEPWVWHLVKGILQITRGSRPHGDVTGELVGLAKRDPRPGCVAKSSPLLEADAAEHRTQGSQAGICISKAGNGFTAENTMFHAGLDLVQLLADASCVWSFQH